MVFFYGPSFVLACYSEHVAFLSDCAVAPAWQVALDYLDRFSCERLELVDFVVCPELGHFTTSGMLLSYVVVDPAIVVIAKYSARDFAKAIPSLILVPAVVVGVGV